MHKRYLDSKRVYIKYGERRPEICNLKGPETHVYACLRSSPSIF